MFGWLKTYSCSQGFNYRRRKMLCRYQHEQEGERHLSCGMSSLARSSSVAPSDVASATAGPQNSAAAFMSHSLLTLAADSSTSSTPPPSLATTPRQPKGQQHTKQQQQQAATSSKRTTLTVPVGRSNRSSPLSFLINGELVMISQEKTSPSTGAAQFVELEFPVTGPIGLHVVCVGAPERPTPATPADSVSSSSNAAVTALPVCRICIWEKFGNYEFKAVLHHVASLCVGEVTEHNLPPPLVSQPAVLVRKIVVEISNQPLGSVKNRSEHKFLEDVVNELLSAQDGAPSMAKLLRQQAHGDNNSRWIPPHAEQLLLTSPQINTFLNNNNALSSSDAVGGICCVARKKAKPKYHRRCPFVQAPLNIRGILKRAALGEAAWKQCGATFSTMMRHFQKSPDVFEWKTDNEKRTVIRHQKQQAVHFATTR